MTFAASEHTVDVLITVLPFALYGGLLWRLLVSWVRVRKIRDRKKEGRLAAVLGVLALCTMLFMVANAYAIHIWGQTFLSFRVFQMFVLSNCVAYWLVLDLVAREAAEDAT